MAILIVDPDEAQVVRSQFVSNGSTTEERFTEMWEGIEVVPPLPNDDHQDIVGGLTAGLYEVVQRSGLGKVRPGVNVSDRADGWTHNFRGPDVVAYLTGNPAINHGEFWEGGPDLLVEVLSRGEPPYAKFDFYAQINTREVLLIFRNPWRLELHQLRKESLELVGQVELGNSTPLASEVLPLTFRLRPAIPRPVIELTHTETGQVWTA